MARFIFDLFLPVCVYWSVNTAKPTQVRVYLDGDEAALAEQLASSMGEDKGWLCRKIMAAGLQALKEKGSENITFPFRFQPEFLNRRKAQAA